MFFLTFFKVEFQLCLLFVRLLGVILYISNRLHQHYRNVYRQKLQGVGEGRRQDSHRANVFGLENSHPLGSVPRGRLLFLRRTRHFPELEGTFEGRTPQEERSSTRTTVSGSIINEIGTFLSTFTFSCCLLFVNFTKKWWLVSFLFETPFHSSL